MKETSIYVLQQEEEETNNPSEYMEKGDSHNLVQIYLKEASQYKLLSFEQEKELSKKIEKNDSQALEELIKCNLRLVIKLASNFVSKDYSFIDLIQDGNIGLIRAAQKFDYRKEVRFSTYAAPWIKQMIIRALSQKKRTIRLPYRKEKMLRKFKKISNDFFNEHKRNPNQVELAKKLNLSIQELQKIHFYEVPVTSLEAHLNDDSFSLEDIIDSKSFHPDDILLKKEMIEETSKAIKSLFPKEKSILLNRFGITDKNKKNTLKEIAKSLGVSAETVRQIEGKALIKLRRLHHHLKNYIYH